MEDGTVTLSAQQPRVGVALTASVEDIDGGVKDITWKWERSMSINSTDGKLVDPTTIAGEEVGHLQGATSDEAVVTPTKKDDEAKYLRAIASYTDGKGKDTAMATSVSPVEARPDNPPKFPKAETGKRYIAENSSEEMEAPVVKNSNGTTAVVADDPVRATDTDAEMTQLLTYSLSRADAALFTITNDTAENARGGQITVKAGTELNYETKPTYMVTVKATDPDGLSASIDVTIKVTNVDEAPEVTGDAKKDYLENGTRDVASYRATDP